MAQYARPNSDVSDGSWYNSAGNQTNLYSYVDESSVVNGNAFVEKVRELVKEENAEVVVIGAGIESDIAELESYDERQMFLDDLGLKNVCCRRHMLTHVDIQ